MSGIGGPRRKGASGRTLAGNQSARSAVAATAAGTLDKREAVIHSREQAVRGREDAAALRERTLCAQEGSASKQAVLSALSDAQLREANEHLVVATLNAQTMTEAAEQATVQMSYMAEHDFLTDLPNRSLLTDRLAQAILRAQRHGKRVALLYLDLDHFKHINDSLGHAIGDQLLQSVAKRLLTCVRHCDTVSRQGGDEFVVLLDDVDGAQVASRTTKKLIDAIAEPHLISGHRLHVTLSVGISLYPDDGTNVETILRNADTAMYSAKRSGRNNYQRFTPAMNARALVRRSVEDSLHHGLEQGGFVLHYQSKVNLETGAITGAEALLRLPKSDRVVNTAKLVRVAEDCGLILPIGKWALHEACRQTAAWLQAGLDIGQIAVNVSVAEFQSKDFLAGVRAILNDTGLDPRHLELELTESDLMQDTEATTAVLHALKDLGVQIAIDDFGTGYSSLSYLRRFPIDTLKIDQSFVHDINGDGRNPLISAIIAIGASLNQRVVAEGIETPHQLACLQSQGCVEGQGYFFSRPVAAEEFAALLEAVRH